LKSVSTRLIPPLADDRWGRVDSDYCQPAVVIPLHLAVRAAFYLLRFRFFASSMA